MDELVDKIIRRTEIEEEQARLIIRMVEAYEREHLYQKLRSQERLLFNQREGQDGLESLSGRGFLG